MNAAVLKHYKEARKPHVSERGLYRPIQAPASGCFRVAKDKAILDEKWDDLENAGLVRIRFEPDYCADYDDLAGDTYNVKLNADSVPGGERTILAQEKDFKRSIEHDGVWGYIVEKRCACCGNWEHVGSCWGFVGDPKDFSLEYLYDQLQAIDEVSA